MPAEDVDVAHDCDTARCTRCLTLVADQEHWPPSSRLVREIGPEEWVAIDVRPRN